MKNNKKYFIYFIIIKHGKYLISDLPGKLISLY